MFSFILDNTEIIIIILSSFKLVIFYYFLVLLFKYTIFRNISNVLKKNNKYNYKAGKILSNIYSKNRVKCVRKKSIFDYLLI